MISPRVKFPIRLAGRKAVLVAAAAAATMTAGVAAAAGAVPTPWSDGPVHDAPAVTEPSGDGSAAVGVEVTVAPDTLPPVSEEPTSTEPRSTEPPATEPPATEPPATEAPKPTEPPHKEPPATPAPTTTDRVVPQGITLECARDGHTVECHWSDPWADGARKVLLLRGQVGAEKGKVLLVTDHFDAGGYVDLEVPAGSYSYVVVTLDEHGVNVLHSNPVVIEVPAV